MDVLLPFAGGRRALKPDGNSPAQSGMKPGAATFQMVQHRSMAGTGSGPVAIIDDVDQYNDACSKVGSILFPRPMLGPMLSPAAAKLKKISVLFLSLQAAGKLIVAYHTAAWCGPCKMIWPHVEELANSNPDVVFLKIDVDEVKRRIVETGTSIQCSMRL